MRIVKITAVVTAILAGAFGPASGVASASPLAGGAGADGRKPTTR